MSWSTQRTKRVRSTQSRRSPGDERQQEVVSHVCRRCVSSPTPAPSARIRPRHRCLYRLRGSPCLGLSARRCARGRTRLDRTSVVKGKSVSVRVDLGGRRIIKKKKTQTTARQPTTHNSKKAYIN